MGNNGSATVVLQVHFKTLNPNFVVRSLGTTGSQDIPKTAQTTTSLTEYGLGFRVQGLGFKAWGLGFKVQSLQV